LIGLTLEYLAALVACDTQNPPRAIERSGRLFEFLNSVCERDFQIEVVDHGQGRVTWFAQRGAPRRLFNVHLDTVPTAGGWSSDPFRMVVEDDRAKGLGACDIKGAAACLLALARHSDVELALLFTTDEEGSSPCCVRRFVESPGTAPELVVVAEPTGGKAVLGHRGYWSQRGTFSGRSSHTSLPKAQRRSAIHDLVGWSAAALQYVAEAERRAGSDVDFCFNIGALSGGLKGNMVADSAEVKWSARVPPGQDSAELVARLSALSGGPAARWETTFSGPALPSTIELRERAWQWAERLGLTLAPDVDFWTEASLFSQRGWPTIVLGPGNIAQAHAADEWVALEQLKMAFDSYSRIAHGDQHP
jgi:acetylornithine deacetylase